MQRRLSIIALIIVFIALFSWHPTAADKREPSGEMDVGEPSGDMKIKQMDMGTAISENEGTHHDKNGGFPVRGSKLIGMKVVNPDREELGSVKDMLIGRDGRVAFLIVARGGVLGIGADLVPIPYSAMDPRRQEVDKIVLDVSLKELEKAPHFSGGVWPDFSNPDYERHINAYFGANPPSR